MKYRIEVRSGQEEDILIYAKEQTPALAEIEKLLIQSASPLMGYLDEEIVPISFEEIDCFCIEAGKVYAFVNLQKILLKERLYQLEELAGNAFVRINQSCLVRISKIKSFAPSIGGALMVTLENGYQDYVSRRQLRTLKERMGF